MNIDIGLANPEIFSFPISLTEEDKNDVADETFSKIVDSASPVAFLITQKTLNATTNDKPMAEICKDTFSKSLTDEQILYCSDQNLLSRILKNKDGQNLLIFKDTNLEEKETCLNKLEDCRVVMKRSVKFDKAILEELLKERKIDVEDSLLSEIIDNSCLAVIISTMKKETEINMNQVEGHLLNIVNVSFEEVADVFFNG